MPTLSLSSVTLDPATGLRRDSPRPAELRNAHYDAAFDWDTLFYDCYRVGRDVVLQGPPLLNLLAPLLASTPLAGARWYWRLPGPHRPRAITMHKRGEIWWRSDADAITLTGPIGTYDLAIQPDMAPLFANRRVLHTLSKNNPPRWIHDWIEFYRAEHGADAALIYDNGSTLYTAAALEAELSAAFPAMVIRVVAWPFRYGPQGGLAGAVDGRETPWDSDFCQTGSMQHARLRFLRLASSVLNVDIDEMVVSSRGRSIFECTERSAGGFIKFAGRWISGATPISVHPHDCRHADFIYRDRAETRECPPKWCIVPAIDNPLRTSWSVHNWFGSSHNRRIDCEFSYRHMTAISNSWKEHRHIESHFDPARFAADDALRDSFARAALARSSSD